MPRCLAIIPARGGSQRIPHKNSRLFHGQPLISYSIQAAQQSQLFTRIIVSTDDDDIAQIAQHYGADVPFMRSTTLSDHYTGTGPVIVDAIQQLQQQQQYYDYVCCLYATAPLLQFTDLIQAFTQLNQQEQQVYAISVTEFSYPVQRGFTMEHNQIKPLFPEAIPKRSQDLPKVYHDAGQFYWGKTEAFLNNVPIFSSATLPIVLPHYRVQDLDTLDDWQRAEFLYRQLFQ